MKNISKRQAALIKSLENKHVKRAIKAVSQGGRNHGGWDIYRECFPDLSIGDLVKLELIWDEWFPKQAHFSLDLISELFIEAQSVLDKLEVIELGCHQGYLAKDILSRFNIDSWTGYDINKSALKRSVVEDERYTTVALVDKWFHEIDLPDFNVFVSSHTLEHMYLEEVEKTIVHVSQLAKYMILEIPILEAGQKWKGYGGTHTLTCDRQTIRDLITSHGFYNTKDSHVKGTTYKWVTGWRK
jgi:hypothetical protein